MKERKRERQRLKGKSNGERGGNAAGTEDRAGEGRATGCSR